VGARGRFPIAAAREPATQTPAVVPAANGSQVSLRLTFSEDTWVEVYDGTGAAVLYDAIDSSDGFYSGHAAREARSLMNVTYRLPSEELDARFCDEATRHGLDGLKGHRTVGGIRASIYNAFPREGVDVLVDFMKDFASRNG